MKLADFLWILLLGLITSIFVTPATHVLFVAATNAHPYLMAFVKFSILSTMGELLAVRLSTGDWKKPHGAVYKFIVWGFIGMMVTLMFQVFGQGVSGAMTNNMLPSFGGMAGKFYTAFMISLIMNVAFAPFFMVLHRFTDTYIDMFTGEKIPVRSIRLPDVIARIDWQGLIGFVVVKTIPFFWIPAHTVTFLVPPAYRVLFAAYLSIVLGIILGYAKMRAGKKQVVTQVVKAAV